MKIKNKSLANNIWFYFASFSLIIIVLLLVMQIGLLNPYYKYVKTNEVKEIANKLENNNFSDLDYDELDELAYDHDMCIEIYSNLELIYASTNSPRGCIMQKGQFNWQSTSYKADFLTATKNNDSYTALNHYSGGEDIVYAVRIDENTAAFINTSMIPIGTTSSILSSQLVYIAIFIMWLAFIISIYASKRISKPILKIKKEAENLEKGILSERIQINSKITELNELAETLENARLELLKIDEYRQDLMANVSHDFKTPLTMIKAYAEMSIDMGDIDSKTANNLNIVIDEADRLNKLVDDMLLLSKTEANITELKLESFDIVATIQKTIQKLDVIANDDINITFRLKKEKIVYADKSKIEQVLYNILNNAINYTKDKVNIRLIDNEDFYLIEIIDNGNGIKEKDLKNIWNKYYRGSKNHTRKTGGSGIGLSIVKKILDNHNVNYGIDSVENKGTTFYFELPKHKPFSK